MKQVLFRVFLRVELSNLIFWWFVYSLCIPKSVLHPILVQRFGSNSAVHSGQDKFPSSDRSGDSNFFSSDLSFNHLHPNVVSLFIWLGPLIFDLNRFLSTFHDIFQGKAVHQSPKRLVTCGAVALRPKRNAMPDDSAVPRRYKFNGFHRVGKFTSAWLPEVRFFRITAGTLNSASTFLRAQKKDVWIPFPTVFWHSGMILLFFYLELGQPTVVHLKAYSSYVILISLA